jgi:mono/diheme cytochrome c family protein
MRRLVFLITVLSLFAACDSRRTVESLTPTASQPTSAAPRRVAAASAPSPVEDGHQIFVANCLGCHGKNADGDTPAGRAWHVPDLHSPPVQALSDEQLLIVIRNGKGKMPAWGGLLSQIDLAHVLAYVHSLKAQ